MKWSPLHLVGKTQSFGVGPESDSQRGCLLPVTVGSFLDSPASGLLCSKWDSSSPHFLGL